MAVSFLLRDPTKNLIKQNRPPREGWPICFWVISQLNQVERLKELLLVLLVALLQDNLAVIVKNVDVAVLSVTIEEYGLAGCASELDALS